MDNDPLIQRGVADLVAKLRGVNVVDTASNVAETLAALSDERPNLVVTELALERPEDGLELIRYIRQHYARVLIVVLSAYPTGAFKERALESGANAYINKRESTDRIALTLRHLLDDGFFSPVSDRQRHRIH